MLHFLPSKHKMLPYDAPIKCKNCKYSIKAIFGNKDYIFCEKMAKDFYKEFYCAYGEETNDKL